MYNETIDILSFNNCFTEYSKIEKVFNRLTIDQVVESINNKKEFYDKNKEYIKEQNINKSCISDLLTKNKADYELITLSKKSLYTNTFNTEKYNNYIDSYVCTKNNVNRFFMDIEHIPTEDTNDKILYNIINDIVNYIKQTKILLKYNNTTQHVSMCDNYDVIDYSYSVTKNYKSSSHEGLSYHVIFKYILIENSIVIKNMFIDFIDKHPMYKNYIDISVYSTKRLFRLPYNKNISRYINDTKIIYANDYHTILKGDNIKDFIIKYIDDTNDNLYMITYDKYNVNYSSKYNNGSDYIKATIDRKITAYLKTLDSAKEKEEVNTIITKIFYTDIQPYEEEEEDKSESEKDVKDNIINQIVNKYKNMSTDELTKILNSIK